MNSDVISKSILNEIEDVVYISDPKTYELYYMNAKLKRDLGSPPEEQWRRKKCYKILQGRDRPCEFCTNHCLSHDGFYTWEHYNAMMDQYFLVQDKLVAFEGIEARLEIAKNITKQKLLENDLMKRLAEQELLYGCIALLHSPESADDSINKLLGLLANYHKAERGYIFLLSDDNALVNNSHEWCAQGVTPQIEILQNVPAEIVSHWFVKYREQGEFFIDSLTEELDPESEEYKILAMQDIVSLVTAPLYNTDGSFMGFIGIDNPREKMRETTVIRAVTSFVADFFDKNRYTQELYRVSYFDNLTGMRNRHSYSNKIAALQEKPPHALGVVYVDINGLKVVNDLHGHKAGDDYIRKLGVFLDELYGDCSFRIGGDEFVMLCPEKEHACYKNKLGILMEYINKDDYPCAAVGYCWREGNTNVIEQIETADRLMYKNKEAQYKEYGGKNDLFRQKYLSDASHHDPIYREE